VLKLCAVWLCALGVLGACGGVFQRFPDDVQAAVAHDDMRRLETEQLIIYYPAPRRAEIDRFVVRAERCATLLRQAAPIHRGPAAAKMVIAMPETAFNNAFVAPGVAGVESISVIPTMATLDFTTEFGLPPDPGFIACHELVHYVHLSQVRGFWKAMNSVFGALYTPQALADLWFVEGLATHYEAALSPGVGRPTWPIFTGIFAAAYAGRHINGGDLSEYGRLSPVGHHYLVGTMFVRYLTERYGERAAWAAINNQAGALVGWMFPRTFAAGFGVSLGDLIDEFDAWHAQRFPARARPATQRALATLGSDARYARGRDGTEAWVAQDVDAPPRLVVRDPDGKPLADLRLLDLLPPRTLVDADPQLVSGLSVTADGREVWLTMIDRATTAHVPRLLRWRRGDAAVTELSDSLGPGATIDPTGKTYYYCAVDGDRWSLAAWDVQRGARRVLVDVAPGTYVLGAQVSPDGARLIANVWDGHAFVAWLLDAATGARISELRGAGTPIWDASFTDDGRAMYLGVVDGRFQIFVDGRAISDAPYAALAARSARGTIRFLNREGWRWTLDELAVPPAVAPVDASAPLAALPDASAAPPAAAIAATIASAPPAAAALAPGLQPPGATPITAPPALAPPVVQSDTAYSAWEHFFYPQVRTPSLLAVSTGVPVLGLVLGGGDRLGLHRWSLAGYVQPRDKEITDRAHWSGSAAYLNSMLAPWQILAFADAFEWVDLVHRTVDGSVDEVARGEQRRTRDAGISLARTWRDTLTATLGAMYFEDRDVRPDEPALDRKLAGPRLTLGWQSGESTPYTGDRRALVGSLSGAYYPEALSSFAGDLYDTRALLRVVAPLPFGRRHTLTAQLRGRALLARDDTGLLQLGGFTDVTAASTFSSVSDTPSFDDDRFPPGQGFSEFLWGYEDYAITTDRAAIATLWWSYPVIFDAGFATTFGFLPPTYFRQLDFELFATAAIDAEHDTHAAFGILFALRFAPLRVPLDVRYQVARRVRDDNATMQLIGVALPF